MVSYIIVFMLCVCMLLLNHIIPNKKIKKIMEISLLIILAFFSGTRDGLGGYDYDVYETVFNAVPKLNKFSLDAKNNLVSELCFLLCMSIVKTLGFSFKFFTLLHSVVFYFLIYKFIKQYNVNFFFIIIIFMYKMFVFNTFVSMRQSIAIGIFLCSFKYIIDKKMLKYFLCCFCALAFHSSAIILFPVYFINRIKFSKCSLCIFSTVLFLIFVLNYLNVDFFNPIYILKKAFFWNDAIYNKIDSYFVSARKMNVLNVVETYAVILFIIYFFNKIYEEDYQKRIIINCFLIIVPIVTAFINYEIMVRVKDYFIIFLGFILYYVSKCLKFQFRNIFCFLVICLSFVAYCRYIYNYDGGSLMPYKSYLFVKNSDSKGDEDNAYHFYTNI